MLHLTFAWLSAGAFAASLGFFFYCYFIAWGVSVAPGPLLRPAVLDVALFSAFALHHSVFARTPLKRLVRSVVSERLERPAYVLASSVLFAVVCWAWQPVLGVLYSLRGVLQVAGYTVAAAGVILTFAGARALGALELAGVRQPTSGAGTEVHRVGANSKREGLQTGGLYAFVRHPLYFAWVLMVFGVPHMTMTRFVFAVVSSLYLVVAIPFEERSLVETFGTEYASYRKKVRWRIIPGIY